MKTRYRDPHAPLLRELRWRCFPITSKYIILLLTRERERERVRFCSRVGCGFTDTRDIVRDSVSCILGNNCEMQRGIAVTWWNSARSCIRWTHTNETIARNERIIGEWADKNCFFEVRMALVTFVWFIPNTRILFVLFLYLLYKCRKRDE